MILYRLSSPATPACDAVRKTIQVAGISIEKQLFQRAAGCQSHWTWSPLGDIPSPRSILLPFEIVIKPKHLLVIIQPFSIRPSRRATAGAKQKATTNEKESGRQKKVHIEKITIMAIKPLARFE